MRIKTSTAAVVVVAGVALICALILGYYNQTVRVRELQSALDARAVGAQVEDLDAGVIGVDRHVSTSAMRAVVRDRIDRPVRRSLRRAGLRPAAATSATFEQQSSGSGPAGDQPDVLTLDDGRLDLEASRTDRLWSVRYELRQRLELQAEIHINAADDIVAQTVRLDELLPGGERVRAELVAADLAVVREHRPWWRDVGLGWQVQGTLGFDPLQGKPDAAQVQGIVGIKIGPAIAGVTAAVDHRGQGLIGLSVLVSGPRR